MILTSPPQSGPSLAVLEFGLTLIAMALSLIWPQGFSRGFSRIEKAFRPLAGKKRLTVAIVGVSAFLLRVALLPLFPVPKPFIPDDFGFLLAADTFAHGRLTNPTPAMWVHFETIHVSMTPTYMTMYFPGQGLLLAAGQLLFGQPWFAVLVVTALMCAAVCWMLQAWLPPNWALLGGVICVLHLGLFSYWVNTYTGAAQLAAIGGALVLGALPRFLKRPSLGYTLAISVGMVMMALTRPYEGVLLCLPVCFVLGRWLLFGKNKPSTSRLAGMAALPVAVVIAGVVWMGYYDYRAFGSPLKLPYTVNRAQYAVAPYYVWQSQKPDPGYRHPVLRQFYYENELPFFTRIHSPVRFLPYSFLKLVQTLSFFAGFALMPPLIMMRRVFLDRRLRFLMGGMAVLAVGMGIEIFLIPHYLAPFTGAFFAIGLQAMRHLWVWKPGGRPIGMGMVRYMLFIVVFLCVLRVFAEPLHFHVRKYPPGEWTINWYGPAPNFGDSRARVQAQLEQLPGPQLAIVRYSAQHELLDEWVYNRADIDDSKVIWAREMDPANDAELMRYYKDRKVWLVQPDLDPAVVEPYPVPQSESTSAR